jgi:CelD/BcsL family acetyltransferase involved in cellulose biosynthesis
MALAEPASRSIEEAGGAATAFQTFAVAERVAEAHLRRGETPRVVVVHDGDRPMVVFPIALTRRSGIAAAHFLGDPLIQYGDVLAAPGATMAHLEAAWHAVADPAVARFVHLRKVRADARIAPLLARTATVVAEHEAPYVDVRAPAAIGSRDARELRRFRRRLAEHGELRFDVLSGRAAQTAVHEALAIKRDWLTVRGMPSSVIGNASWENTLMTLAGPGSTPLRVARLSVGGRTAAIEVGFVHERVWYAYIGATAPFAAKAGPGHVQMAELIAHCRAEHLGTYDLQAPADPYKRTIAHGAIAVRDHAAMLTASGWLGLTAARAGPAVKQLLTRMPAGLRRAVVRLRR